MNGTVFVYKTNGIFRVPKDEVTFTSETKLPALCFYNEKKSCAVATEFLEEEGEYLMDNETNKIFSYTLFDESSLPSKIGEDIYLSDDGKLSKNTSEKKVGAYMGRKGNAILFKFK